MTKVQQERRCSAGRKPRKHEPCRMQTTSMWALWWLTGAGASVSGEPGEVGHVCGVMNTTEPVHILEGCTSRISSFRNISEIKPMIEVYALSQFTAVNELLGQPSVICVV